MLKIIKELCEKKGISLKELSIEAGLTERSIYRWDDSLPSVDKAQRVAKVLGVSVDYLLGVEDTDYDPEIYAMMQQLSERPELRMLLKASKDVPKESIEAMLRLLNYDSEN